ncbi:MAG: O-antigen ligase family protein [Candidatus Aureabacteria bacterium]|nr:O-antigen ligase family protein [Candidatus Auribacterota bacterium]
MFHRNLCRGVRNVAFLLISLSPWAYSRAVDRSFYTPKLVLVVLSCALLAPLFVSCARRAIPRHLWAVCMCIWGCLAIISVGWSDFPIPGCERAAGVVLCVVIFFCFAGIASSEKDRRRAAAILFLTGAAQALLSILQWRGVDPLFGDVTGGLSSQDITKRMLGTLGYQNTLGGYLALILPLGFYLYAAEKMTWRRWLWGISGGTIVVSLILTRSRGAWLGAVAATTVFTALAASGGTLRLRPRPLLWVLSGVLAITLLTMWITHGDTTMSVANRMRTALSFRSSSMCQRALIWKATWRMISERPLAGHGLGTFQIKYLDSLGGVLEDPANAALRRYTINVKESHNDYLQMWAEMGLAGLILWLVFVALCMRYLARAAHNTHYRMDERLWCASSAGLLAGFAVLGLTAFPLQTLPTAPLFWMLIGTGLGITLSEHGNDGCIDRKEGQGLSARLSLSLSMGVIICLIFIISDRLLLVGRNASARGYLTDAERVYHRAVTLTPWDGEVRFYNGLCLQREGNFSGAQREFLKGAMSFADVNLWRALSRACGARGDCAGGIGWLDRARKTRIEATVVKRELGTMLIQCNNSARGVSLLRDLSRPPLPDLESSVVLARYYIDQRLPQSAIDSLWLIATPETGNLNAVSRKYGITPAKMAEALDTLGVAWLLMKKPVDAELFFRQALGFNPADLGTENNLASSLAMQGRKEEAMTLWRRVLTRDPYNKTAKQNLSVDEKSIRR